MKDKVANTINLLLALDVDTTESRKNIDKYINSLKDIKIKVELEANGISNVNNSLGNTSKVVEDLKKQVSSLKKEISSLGGTSSSSGFDSFRREIGESVKSLDDLEKAVKKYGGTVKQEFEKGILPSGMEDDRVLKRITASFNELDGTIRKITYKPDLDFFGEIKELNQIKETVQNIDFKDFDKKAKRTQDNLNKLGRQGVLTADQMKDLQERLDALGNIKSVSLLEDLNREIKEIGTNANQTARFSNALANISNQISPVIAKLRELNNLDGIDKMGLNGVINELQRLQNLKTDDILNDQQLKQVNREFKNAENRVKDFIKEANRIERVNGQIAKLEDSIEKLVKAGKLDRDQADGFLVDTQLISKTTEAVKKLQQSINETLTRNQNKSQIEQTIENVSLSVDKLNDRLQLLSQRLGSNIDQSQLQNLRTTLERIGNTQINSVDQIEGLNRELRDTEILITRLDNNSTLGSQFENNLRRANQALENLQRTGYLAEDTLSQFRNSLNNIPTGDLDTVRRITNEIGDALRDAGNARALSNTIQGLTRELGTLETQLNRVSSADNFNPDSAMRLRNEIERIRRELNQLPSLDIVTQADLDRIRNGLQDARTDIRNTARDIDTLAERNLDLSDTIVNAFQKFALWTGIGGILFGVTTGVQDLIEKTIELDTALTGLIRVADGEAFEFDTIIERAIDNVSELSGKTTQYLEILEEFTRQGNTLQESLDLADTTQILTNISDLESGEATDALIAGMINFNIAAEDSIRIADRLNEVNYSPL